MILDRHGHGTPMEVCLLIVSENAMRFLYMLGHMMHDTPEYIKLAESLNIEGDALADLSILNLVDDRKNNLAECLITERGIQLLQYAEEQGVDIKSLVGRISESPIGTSH